MTGIVVKGTQTCRQEVSKTQLPRGAKTGWVQLTQGVREGYSADVLERQLSQLLVARSPRHFLACGCIAPVSVLCSALYVSCLNCLLFIRTPASLVAQTGKNLPSMRETWLGKIPWRRKWQPAPVFLPGKSHGQRSLAGYSPWGLKRVEHDLVNNSNSSYKSRRNA